MTRASLVAAIVVAATVGSAGCPRPPEKVKEQLKDTINIGEGDPRNAMIAELQDDIFDSYERDDPPDTRPTDMLPAIADSDRRVGIARIGVGPKDMFVNDDVSKASSRWPLAVERDVADARSKRLEIHLSQDQLAAWMFDEVSWRIKICGRIAVIPLRITALYAHDGDRWIQVFEHVSFGRPPAPTPDGKLAGVEIKSEVIARDVADAVSGALNPVLSNAIRDPNVLATSADAMLLGPDVASEWHGPQTLSAKLVDGKITTEARRVGTVGQSVAKATIAYWVGTLVADLPATATSRAGRARLRGSFVFEKRKITTNQLSAPDDSGHVKVTSASTTERWVLVQGHVSTPIPDDDLATIVFGTSLLSLDPLRLSCDQEAPRATNVPTPVRPAAR